MSGASERTSELPSTAVCIFRCSGPQCNDVNHHKNGYWFNSVGKTNMLNGQKVGRFDGNWKQHDESIDKCAENNL